MGSAPQRHPVRPQRRGARGGTPKGEPLVRHLGDLGGEARRLGLGRGHPVHPDPRCRHPPVCSSRTVAYCTMPAPAPVTEAIEGWAPRRHRPEVVAFARRVVTAAEPKSAARAKALLFAAGSSPTSPRRSVLALDEEVLLRASLIERFVSSRFAGDAADGADAAGQPALLGRSRPPRRGARSHRLAARRAKTPYTGAELAAYLALADAQPTPLRRARAGALICLGGRGGAHRRRAALRARQRRGVPLGRRARRRRRAKTTRGAGAGSLSRAPARRGRVRRRALSGQRDEPAVPQRDQPAVALAVGGHRPAPARDATAALVLPGGHGRGDRAGRLHGRGRRHLHPAPGRPRRPSLCPTRSRRRRPARRGPR